MAQAVGRAAAAGVVADGIFTWLRKMSRAFPEFDAEAKKVSHEVALILIDRARKNAQGIPPHGIPKPRSSGRSQAQAVVEALRPKKDRLISIQLNSSQTFRSESYPNRKRKAAGKVNMGKVFYGAEFGGAARKTTMQFRPHRGRQGYFFWQAVRDNKEEIAKLYFGMMQDTIDRLAVEAGGK